VIMAFRISQIKSSLSAKLISGFLLLTVLSLLVMVAISLYALRELTNVTHQLQEISGSLEAVERLETAFAKSVTPLSAYLLNGTPGEHERFQVSIREVEARLQGCAAAACHENSKQPALMTEHLLPFVQALKDRAGLIFGDSRLPTEKDKVRILDEMNQLSEEAGLRLNRMSSALVRRVAYLQDESRAVNRRAVALILASVLLVLALGALAAYWLSRRLLRHVNALLVGTRHIKQGDLGYRVASSVPDEIGQLTDSFNAMAEEIQHHREHLQRMVEERTADLKEAQASLLQSEKLASIGLLASGVAHELNNPLTSILMNVNLLMEDVADQPALKMELQRINEDTMRCKGIIDDLRDFSRRQELELVPTDLNRLVQEVLASVGRRKEFARIRVFQDLSAAMARVPCDPARMEQVLSNIFVNAVQAMPEGGSLRVRTWLRRDLACISVRDSGFGIPDDIRSRIFDPFFTTKPHGTGLGLSIVYRIMEAHGGQVEVHSMAQEQQKEGGQVGTEIVLCLPLVGKNDDMPIVANEKLGRG